MNTMEITPSFPPIMPATPDVVPKVEMSPTPNLSAPLVEYSPPRQSVPPSLPTGIQDQQIPSYSYSTEIPGSTCMRQFPMRSSAQRLADTAESADARQSGHQRFHPPFLFQYRYQSHGDLGMHTHILRRSCGRRPEVFGLAPQLHQSPHGDQPSESSEHYIPHAPSTSPSLHETQLLEAAMKLQMKAAKSDLVFRMVDPSIEIRCRRRSRGCC